ncbi:DNA-directed RNA polymerase subunit beta' [Gossypium arboreum]|uniref:DNA-directed RNA polymerase subunit beta n=1 Tax=Gossypium arboreum TaxID=29729 RepID=A0A0B0N641_GOSAR|nr:DNA-directed RNA polymerase subunit beta' [Gossypium arboreum]
MRYSRKYWQSFNVRKVSIRYVFSCKTMSGTLALTYDLRVRPCLGHWHRI